MTCHNPNSSTCLGQLTMTITISGMLIGRPWPQAQSFYSLTTTRHIHPVLGTAGQEKSFRRIHPAAGRLQEKCSSWSHWNSLKWWTSDHERWLNAVELVNGLNASGSPISPLLIVQPPSMGQWSVAVATGPRSYRGTYGRIGNVNRPYWLDLSGWWWAAPSSVSGGSHDQISG